MQTTKGREPVIERIAQAFLAHHELQRSNFTARHAGAKALEEAMAGATQDEKVAGYNRFDNRRVR